MEPHLLCLTMVSPLVSVTPMPVHSTQPTLVAYLWFLPLLRMQHVVYHATCPTLHYRSAAFVIQNLCRLHHVVVVVAVVVVAVAFVAVVIIVVGCLAVHNQTEISPLSEKGDTDVQPKMDKLTLHRDCPSHLALIPAT
jgi:hypothetical protein